MQSSALLVASATGQYDCPRADVAIFADTQDEPAYVYEQLDRLTEWARPYGVTVHKTTAGSLSEHVLASMQRTKSRFVNIPVYSLRDDGSENMLRRQCTREFKLAPIERKARELMGYRKGQRVKGAAEALIGISRDEAHRMKPSRTPWIRNVYPLVDANLKRRDCVRIVMEAGLPEPKKSACVYCPFKSDAEFIDMRDNHPTEWARAVAFDAAIRTGSEGDPLFIHRSCKPLDQAEFRHDGQADMWGNECEGMCGV